MSNADHPKAPGVQEARTADRSTAEANGLVCLAGCAEDHTTRESARTTVSHHNGVDIVATRELSRTDPSTLELLADQAMQGQRQGTTQVKNKDIATWRRSFVETTAWPHAVLGRDQLPPLCAAVRHTTVEDKHSWKTVKGGKETKARRGS